MNKDLFITIALASVPVWLQGTAWADVTITGTGDPATDALSLQGAVDGGGVVTILGTLNLGTSPSISIKNDVVIQGVTDRRGEPVTRIRGGTNLFRVSVPPSPQPPRSPVTVVIRDLACEGARNSWINFQDFKALEVRNVRVRLHPSGGFAVALQPRLQATPTRRWDGGELGDVTIENSVFEVPSDRGFNSLGIFINNLGNLDASGGHTRPLKAVTVVVRNNKVSTRSVGVMGHSFAGTALYAGNEIQVDGDGRLPPDFNAAIGLFMGNNLAGNVDRADIRTDVATHNSIQCGPFEDAAGIVITGSSSGTILNSNEVGIERGSGVLAGPLATGINARSLKITGSGESALELNGNLLEGTTTERRVESNTFVGLNLQRFTASAADITLVNANNNLFVGIGNAGVSETTSTGNVFTGLNVRNAGPGTVGRVVSSAVQALLSLSPDVY